MSKRLQALRQRRTQIKEDARAITAVADAENRDLTDEESAKIDAFIKTGDSVQSAIEQEERLADLDRVANTVATPLQVADDAIVQTGDAQIVNDPKGGFKSYGEFAMSVMQAGMGGGIDERLGIGAAAPTTYGNEGTGADGGFMVPVEFSNEIKTHSLGEGAFLPMTDSTDIQGNSMSFPADETTPWGTNGIRAYWENEAAAATQTKPSGKLDTLRLKKLMALVPVTDELMADSTALTSYLTRKTGDSILWKTNDAIINGTGAGQPLGVFNSDALVTVAKETSQTADTINAANVSKMYGRLPASSMSRAVWLVNNDAWNQLPQMTIGDMPVFVPPGITGTPGGSLFGRPVIVTQTAQTLGDKGDIMLVDFGSYNSITKAGGIEYATSIHLYFDAGSTAFRATYRVDGQPWLNSAITPANGSNSLSPFVTLAARA